MNKIWQLMSPVIDKSVVVFDIFLVVGKRETSDGSTRGETFDAVPSDSDTGKATGSHFCWTLQPVLISPRLPEPHREANSRW